MTSRKDRVISGFTAEQSAALFREFSRRDDDIAEAARKDGSVEIFTEDVVARAGQFLRVSPPAEGMAVLLPAPDRTRPGSRVTVSIERPAGDCVFTCIPSQDKRKVTQGSVNGETRATYSVAGIVDLVCNGQNAWNTQAELPAESPAGAVGATGPAGQDGQDGAPGTITPATGAEDGYLSRKVYVNASSAAVGATFAGETCEAAVTWTTSADVPDGNWIHVWGTGSGGGGASGQAIQSTTAAGSAGGGGAATWERVFSRAEIIAALPLTFVAPLGGAGGAQVVAGSGVTTGSNFGVSGSAATFGTLWRAGGGGGGRGGNGNRAGGAGGGIFGSGQGGDTSTSSATGGDPGGGTGEATAFAGAGSSASPNLSSNRAIWGGGSGNGGGSSVPTAGGTSVYGCGGGGASGNCSGAGSGGTASVTASSDGGAAGGDYATVRGGGGAGVAGSVDAAGNNGSPGATGVACRYGGAGGGAGGSSVRNAASSASPGGIGGAGGFPGGGGGAGGSSVSNGNATKTGGAGGKGGDSVIVVTFYA